MKRFCSPYLILVSVKTMPHGQRFDTEPVYTTHICRCTNLLESSIDSCLRGNIRTAALLVPLCSVLIGLTILLSAENTVEAWESSLCSAPY